MAFRRAIYSGVPVAEAAGVLTSALRELWPAQATSDFGNLLRAIDDAVIRQRCVSRLRRMHRMLARV